MIRSWNIEVNLMAVLLGITQHELVPTSEHRLLRTSITGDKVKASSWFNIWIAYLTGNIICLKIMIICQFRRPHHATYKISKKKRKKKDSNADRNADWANVGPTSVLSSRRWANISPIYIAVWGMIIGYILLKPIYVIHYSYPNPGFTKLCKWRVQWN